MENEFLSGVHGSLYSNSVNHPDFEKHVCALTTGPSQDTAALAKAVSSRRHMTKETLDR